ncbi:hypothetical protein SDC9_146802 [bioreactor metagenome]|uniref:Uncharacterized protein n=1 Tax=bioreactor metagenome TaxID=1076179 RepID=A0A645ECP2_9ZZZZ
MQQNREPSWSEQWKMIQDLVEEKLERRSLVIKLVLFFLGVFVASSLLTGIIVQRQRMKQVVRSNRNGLMMDLQGLRHLIRQSTHGTWDQSDAKTLMAIRRSVLARVSTLETADLRLSKVWSRLMNYLNYVMGAIGEEDQKNETLEGFEKILRRLELVLESDHPSKVEMSSILQDLDQLTAV